MTCVRVLNLTRPDTAPLSVRLCASFWSRFRGLMFTPSVALHGGVLIDEKTDSRVNTTIHMFFMNYDIAAVWIGSAGVVVDRVLARRWQPYYAPSRPARYILETHPDRLADFQVDDRVKLLDE